MGGDLERLKDGRLFLAYSQWTSGSTDADSSRIVGQISEDNGGTWGEIFTISEPDETRDNVRMPSFVRLGDGQLALFVRCHLTMDEKWVEMMTCHDESVPILDAASWSVPRRVTPAPPGGHIIIASRVIRTHSGRLIVPIATPWPWRRSDEKKADIRTTLMLSDNDGVTWRQSRTTLHGPGRGAMEPTVVELPSGRLMMLMRTQTHRQYVSYSEDCGETWGKAIEVTRLISPESPAALALEPNTGWTMVVWNRNSNLGTMRENRTPLTVGFSSDEGNSWFGFHNLEDEPGKTWFYPTLRILDGIAHVIYSERTETEAGETRIALKMKTLRVEEG
jgi:sialidase-1